MPYANNKDADQPAHLRSVISIFVIRSLDRLTFIDAISKISRCSLTFVSAQAVLCLTWWQTPEDRFSHDLAHLMAILSVLLLYSPCSVVNDHKFSLNQDGKECHLY